MTVGIFLANLISARGLKIAALARLSGVPRQTIHEALRGRPVRPATCRALALGLGVSEVELAEVIAVLPYGGRATQ